MLRLRTKPAIEMDSGDDSDFPAYVSRQIDADVEARIRDGGMVLLHGRAAAGKSRTVIEALRRLRPSFALMEPVRARALRELVDGGYLFKDIVVFLDDLERFLVPDGLDVGLLQRMAPPGRHDVIVMATIRNEELARFNHAATASLASRGCKARFEQGSTS